MRILQIGLASILVVALAASLPGLYYYTEAGPQAQPTTKSSTGVSTPSIDRLDLKTVKDVSKPPKPEPSKLPDTTFELGEMTQAEKLEAQRALRVRINEAPMSQLNRLPGVGPSTAKNIIKYRKKDELNSVNELKEIPGIGPATSSEMADKLIIDGKMPNS